MNNPITYSKEIKKSYDVLRFEINNIPVLEKEKLSIYQKYIILILNNGVVARNQNALIDILSTILNIKKSFVKDFVETLVELKYLIHNDKTNNYQLSDSYKIMMDQKDGTIMKANTIKRYAEFKDLYYIEKFNKIVGREYFENNNITLTRKSRKINKNVYDILNQKTSEQNTVNHIQNILKEFFDKDDITLSNDFKYTLTDNFDTYQMDLDVVLFYEYNNEISNLQNIQYNTSLDISNEILKDIKEEYNVDKKIPRFIELKEKFYDALEKNDKELIDIENRYTQKNNDKKNIESFINLYEAKIKELKTIQPDKINQNIEIIENLNNNVQSKNQN